MKVLYFRTAVSWSLSESAHIASLKSAISYNFEVFEMLEKL